MNSSNKILMQIPNALSIFRLISPFLIVSFYKGGLIEVAFILFLAAAVSDFLDGFLARKYSATSKFGSIVDPLADKILIICLYVFFCQMKVIYQWVSIIIVLRDMFIMVGVAFLYFRKKNVKFTPVLSSKINTMLEILLIVIIFYENIFVSELQLMKFILIFFVMSTISISCAEYTKIFMKVWKC